MTKSSYSPICPTLVVCLITSLSGMLQSGLAGEMPADDFKLVKTTIAYREVNGHKILADIHRPADEQIRPVIVWIHGGALIMGHREGVHRQIRELAAKEGYAIVSIDYRLAPETKLPDIISDIEAAFRWLAEEGAKKFHLDTNRVAVAGGSAGGYLTLITGYRVQPKPKAVVALYGYGDLVGEWYSKPSPHRRHNFRQVDQREAKKQSDGTVISDSRERKGSGGLIYLHYRQKGIWPEQVSGFDRSTIARKIQPYEPLRNVSKKNPPTMLIHGTRDTDVPFQQSQMMAKELKRHQVPHRLIAIKNGEHGFGGGDRKQIDRAYAQMKAFLVKHLSADR